MKFTQSREFSIQSEGASDNSGALSNLRAELTKAGWTRINLPVRGEQFPEVTHLVQPLLVVLHACFHQYDPEQTTQNTETPKVGSLSTPV